MLGALSNEESPPGSESLNGRSTTVCTIFLPPSRFTGGSGSTIRIRPVGITPDDEGHDAGILPYVVELQGLDVAAVALYLLPKGPIAKSHPDAPEKSPPPTREQA